MDASETGLLISKFRFQQFTRSQRRIGAEQRIKCAVGAQLPRQRYPRPAHAIYFFQRQLSEGGRNVKLKSARVPGFASEAIRLHLFLAAAVPPWDLPRRESDLPGEFSSASFGP